MAEKLKLGIVGCSPGNGHPYSWSAIFNGYNASAMESCEYPTISDYLGKQEFPKDFLYHLASVESIFTQKEAESEKISKASKIKSVCTSIEELVEQVDAILLARDDAKSRLEHAEEIIKSGLPVFIDKPAALSIADWNQLLRWQTTSGQIFSCSSLRYAKELQLSQNDISNLGEVQYVEAYVPKQWDTYSVHIIEPAFNIVNDWSEIEIVKQISSGPIKTVEVKKKSGIQYRFNVTGQLPSDISFKLYGNQGMVIKKFSDSFGCFKSSLNDFVTNLNNGMIIPRSETEQIIEVIEKGRL